MNNIQRADVTLLHGLLDDEITFRQRHAAPPAGSKSKRVTSTPKVGWMVEPLLIPDRVDRCYIICVAKVAGEPEAILKRAQQAVMIKDAIE